MKNDFLKKHNQQHKGPFRVVEFLVLDFLIQFLKQNMFNKNGVEMIFKLFSKYFCTHFQNQEKNIL